MIAALYAGPEPKNYQFAIQGKQYSYQELCVCVKGGGGGQEQAIQPPGAAAIELHTCKQAHIYLLDIEGKQDRQEERGVTLRCRRCKALPHRSRHIPPRTRLIRSDGHGALTQSLLDGARL